MFITKSPNQLVLCKTTFKASIRDQKLEILRIRRRTVSVDVSNLSQIAAEKELTVL